MISGFRTPLIRRLSSGQKAANRDQSVWKTETWFEGTVCLINQCRLPALPSGFDCGMVSSDASIGSH